ncbi:Hypothetical_protein [Hexamita inflata]|uniref:Hypothetical_protein n=1 Tax=Hexamita inflata TaxID=28002 RepID=A0AA86USD9_9EUKA|nr:Hypothetical protein HINF_LOCUS50506 [Hexamita inflata]
MSKIMLEILTYPIKDINKIHLKKNFKRPTNIEKLRVRTFNSKKSNTKLLKQHSTAVNNKQTPLQIVCVPITSSSNVVHFLNSLLKFNQTKPSKEEVRKAKQIIRIERQNLKLKEIPQKMHQTTFNNFKQEINAVLNNACQSQIQFTSNVVRLFQQLNQFGFE